MTAIEHRTSISKRTVSKGVVDTPGNQSDDVVFRLPAAGTSFFLAIHLLAPKRREALRALYAFCRSLHDIADGDAPRALKEALLSNWRSEITLLYARRPQHRVTRALHEAVDRYGLNRDDFLKIIEGMQIDARADVRAPSFAELDLYCECVAVAPGRLSMRIFGEETSAGDRVAAELGLALQLTKILRHLVEDGARNRLYLPRELLRAHGIFATIPSWVLAQPALPDVCRDLSAVAERHYARAAAAIAELPQWRLRLTPITMVYRVLLNELLTNGWRSPGVPVRLSRRRKLALALRYGLIGR
jgi:phytoene synthase